MSHTGGDQEKLDILQTSEGEWINSFDWVIIDHEHGNILRSSEGVTRQCVNPEFMDLFEEMLVDVLIPHLLYPRYICDTFLIPANAKPEPTTK